MEFLDTILSEAYFPCSELRGIQKCPSQREMRPDFPEAIEAGPWGPRSNLRGIPNFLRNLEENHGIPPHIFKLHIVLLKRK